MSLPKLGKECEHKGEHKGALSPSTDCQLRISLHRAGQSLLPCPLRHAFISPLAGRDFRMERYGRI